jgi:hypothetical protein
MNVFQGQIVSASSEAGIIKLSGGALLSAAVDAGQLKTGDPVTIGIRPDDVTLDNGEANQLPVRLRTSSTRETRLPRHGRNYGPFRGALAGFVLR